MTNTAKHTPGPWFAHGRYIGTQNHKSAIAECRDINGNWSNDAPASDNARLIAAAPELLEALRGLYLDLVANDQDGLVEHVETMGKARAAIAKATGGAA